MGIKPRALCVLGKLSITELHPQPFLTNVLSQVIKINHQENAPFSLDSPASLVFSVSLHSHRHWPLRDF
jgi:hypothetical protein